MKKSYRESFYNKSIFVSVGKHGLGSIALTLELKWRCGGVGTNKSSLVTKGLLFMDVCCVCKENVAPLNQIAIKRLRALAVREVYENSLVLVSPRDMSSPCVVTRGGSIQSLLRVCR